MFGRKQEELVQENSKTPPPPPEAPKYKLKKKIADLNWEIAEQPGSGNLRRYFEDGRSEPVMDLQTILLWEILKALSK